jgi:RNA 2',3'-cyclic 3'-phosphodiesterase
MRLFTGLSIPPPILQTLTATLDQLRPTAPLHWSPSENLHITLKFIGAWPEPRLPELRQTLESIPQPGPIPIDIDRFGYFPNPHRPHSFFAAVHAGPQLASLAAAIDEALVKIGCPPENRPYTPHLTLARIKGQNIRDDIRSLREHIAAMNNLQFGSFEATHFHLYASNPNQGVSVYSILASYPLGASASVGDSE